MRADEKTGLVMDHIARRGASISFADAETLRRAERTLHRWYELECGDGNNYASWSIERDEKTDKPYMVTHPHDGPTRRRAIPDREKGAQRRIEAVCKANGLHHYYQTDPRGAALYVSPEPLTDQNYSTDGVCCNVG